MRPKMNPMMSLAIDYSFYPDRMPVGDVGVIVVHL